MPRSLVASIVLGLFAPFAIGQDAELERALSDLRAEDYEARRRAEARLFELDPGTLPVLLEALAAEEDVHARLALERIVAALEIERLRRHGLGGGSIERLELGPFEPGPLRFVVLAPTGVHEVEGPHVLISIENLGSEPVELDWPDRASAGAVPAADLLSPRRRGETRIAIRRIGPRETAWWAWYPPAEPGRGPWRLWFAPRPIVRRGSLRTRIESAPSASWWCVVHEPTPAELAAAAAEVERLAPLDRSSGLEARLARLVADRRVARRIDPGILRLGYETAAGDGARRAWLEAIVERCSEEEAVAYLAERIRGGDVQGISRVHLYLGVDFRPDLVRLLGHAESFVVASAARRLAEIGTGEDLPIVLESFDGATEEAARRWLFEAAAALGAPREWIQSRLDDEELATLSVSALLARHDPSALGRMLEWLDSDQEWRRDAAVRYLGHHGDRGHAERLIGLDRGGLVRRPFAREAIGRLGGDRARAYLEDAVGRAGTGPWDRIAALRGLGHLGPEGLRAVGRWIGDERLGLEAAWQLSRISAPTLDREKWHLVPLRRPATLGEILARLPFPARVEDLPGLEALEPVDPHTDRVSIPFLLEKIAARDPNVGFVLTDEGLRILPRRRMVDFYRALPIE